MTLPVNGAAYVYQTADARTTHTARTLTRWARAATMRISTATPGEEGTLTTRVKICGVTNADDAALAASLGADFVGLIFADSPRRVTPAEAAEIVAGLPTFQQTVGVFLNAAPADVVATCSAVGLDYAQLHGTESPAVCSEVAGAGIPVIKVLTIVDGADLDAAADYADASAFLLDRPRGGEMYDWNIAREAVGSLSTPIWLAGGLTPDNVAAAIDAAAPYAVDVGSGVEAAPGRKDPYRLAAFIAAARG